MAYQVTTKDVSALRERTGVGMMDCKKALQACEGDMEKAIEFLREKGLAAAAKKSGRIAAEGMAYATVCTECKKGVVVEVNCETDFAAKSDAFVGLTKDIASYILKNKPADVAALLASEVNGTTVDAIMKDKIYTIGENLSIRRFAIMEGQLASDVHAGGRIGVLVKFDTTDEIASKPGFAEMAKDVAMQIAANNPLFLNRDSVDADTLTKEKEIARQQALNDGKPEAVVDKIVNGRIAKYFKEVCLVEQPFVKDPEISVTQYINAKAKELGGEIAVVGYERYERGEGLAKKEDNFAEEVANMIK